MKLQIMSDLHLEFHRDGGESFIESLPVAADTLIVAGDLTSLDTLFETLHWLGAKWKHVIYVPGNHELYGGHTFREMRDLFKDFRENAIADNVYILDNNILELEGQRFLGTTLWFEDVPDARMLTGMISDFSSIRNPTEIFTENVSAMGFLRRNLREGDVVITHHIPHVYGIAENYRGTAMNVYFYCPMEELIVEREPALWVFGHTHFPADFMQGPTRLVANPFGYPHQDTRFVENLVVEV